MSNQFYIKKLVDEIKELMGNVRFSETTDRNATRGEILEEVFKSLLERLLPNRCGVGGGHIIDSKDGISLQTDIIIYDRDSIPPITFGRTSRESRTTKGFFPIDICWYAIEIKKTLRLTELKSAINNLNSVKNLQVTRNMTAARMLFAYSSNRFQSIDSLFESYKLNDTNWNTDPIINVICLANKGYMYFKLIFDSERRNVIDKYWVMINNDINNFEVFYCLSGIVNTITGQNFDAYIRDSTISEKIIR